MNQLWSDYFTVLSTRKVGTAGWKTNKADETMWKGHFDGRSLSAVSTVRLSGSNMAHFLVNSGARIGENAWNLYGGHYVDLRILTNDRLTAAELRRLGELARTEDTRPVRVRQGRDRLAEAVPIPGKPTLATYPHKPLPTFQHEWL